MISRQTSLALTASAALIAGAQAATTTWTNFAADGDWNNAANWDNGIPVDEGPASGYGSPGFTATPDDLVIFAGPMPTTNVPSLGGANIGSNRSTPSLQLNSGGTLTLTAGAGNIGGIVTEGVLSRTVFTVGDGISGAGENVTLDLTLTGALNRHAGNTTHNYIVNEDGTFNITMTGGTPLQFASEAGRFSTITLNGGTFFTSATINQIGSGGGSQTNNFVDISAAGASFTAAFGNDFVDLAAVDAATGSPTSFFRSSTSQTLSATDNGNGTFTVAVAPIPEPSSSLLLIGGLTLVGLRRRR